MKIKKVKFFHFRRADGELVEIPVPENWNQSLVPKVVRDGYSIRVVIASKPPAEAAYSTVAQGKGHTGGYILPGAAILSRENPYRDDAAYVAYSLLVADAVCSASHRNDYTLGEKNCQSASSREQIFKQNAFYLITWNKHFNSPATLDKDYALALCQHGLIVSNSDAHPTELYSEYAGDGATLRLKATPTLPDYIIEILGSLVPYCKNPYLRFFYLYQVVEYLMGIEFDARVTEVRGRFDATRNPSVVELREILEKFQDATREKSRINRALSPECPKTLISADALLAAVGALETDVSFAEKMYRVRNTLFHDYRQLHDKGEHVSVLCQDFFAYLVEQKLLA